MRFIFVVLILGVCAACPYGGDREFDLAFPAQLVVQNETGEAVRIDRILSTPDVFEGFLLNPVALEADATVSYQLNSAAFEGIVAGRIVIEAACAERDAISWVSSQFSIMPDKASYTVVIALMSCTP